MRTWLGALLWALVVGCAGTPAVVRATPPAAQPDGAHDFDFEQGTFRTEIRRLAHPLSGDTTWVSAHGVVKGTPVWNGAANLEELEIDSPGGHLEGLTLRLYDPTRHRWNLYWANSAEGTLGPASVGRFQDGRGEFVDQEQFQGRSIEVRQRYFDITPTSYRFEQAFSADGGKTWEPNWVASLTRVSDAETLASPPEQKFARSSDFDFNLGRWDTHVDRLEKPLSGSNAWASYQGSSTVRPIWGGRASLFELDVRGSEGRIQGLGLRLYDPKTRTWNLNWANRDDGTLTTPAVGGFHDGVGQFFDQEPFHGRPILVRNGFSDITPVSSKFEQAFSADGGKTWETNWVMTFQRPAAADAGDPRHAFDWELGTWRLHTRRLLHPLTGSHDWVDLEGTVVVRKVWDGRASLAEVELDGPTGHIEFLSLRLYDPTHRTWSLHFANSASGSLSPATVGSFHDGIGEFYDDEVYEGRPIRMRFLFQNVGPNAGRSEQSFSSDGGKTWEVNWINTYTRIGDAGAVTESLAPRLRPPGAQCR